MLHTHRIRALTLVIALFFVSSGAPAAYADPGDTSTSDDPSAITEDPGTLEEGGDTVAGEIEPAPTDPCVLDPYMDARCRPNGAQMSIEPSWIYVDRAAIEQYARTFHGDLSNPRSSSGYNPYYVTFSNDCQNFVSQALYAGGWTFDYLDSSTDTQAWFYRNRLEGWSRSWSVVPAFMTYAKRSDRGVFVRYWSNVRVGDVVFVDWNGPTPTLAPLHSMIVTQIVGTPGQVGFDVKFTYHTNNRLDKSLASLSAVNVDAVWWAFHLYTRYPAQIIE